MNMEMVRPNRSSVYLRESLAIVSRYGSAAGESRAMKSFTSQRLLARARRTSLSVMEAIRSVVSCQLIFCNSSENILSVCFGAWFECVFFKFSYGRVIAAQGTTAVTFNIYPVPLHGEGIK